MSVRLPCFNLSLTCRTQVNKEQRSALYEAIRGHVVTLRGSRVGSKVIWLLCVYYKFQVSLLINSCSDRMRAYYGY